MWEITLSINYIKFTFVCELILAMHVNLRIPYICTVALTIRNIIFEMVCLFRPLSFSFPPTRSTLAIFVFLNIYSLKSEFSGKGSMGYGLLNTLQDENYLLWNKIFSASSVEY